MGSVLTRVARRAAFALPLRLERVFGRAAVCLILDHLCTVEHDGRAASGVFTSRLSYALHAIVLFAKILANHLTLP